MTDNINLLTKKEIIREREYLQHQQYKYLKLFLKKFLNFIHKLNNGELKINKYHLFAKKVPKKIYNRIIYPYFLQIMEKEHLLFKMYRNFFGSLYLKNIDTPLYRKRIYLYFKYLTQRIGIKPPTFFDLKSAKKLALDINSLCYDYGFTIDIKRYYDRWYDIYKYKIIAY